MVAPCLLAPAPCSLACRFDGVSLILISLSSLFSLFRPPVSQGPFSHRLQPGLLWDDAAERSAFRGRTLHRRMLLAYTDQNASTNYRSHEPQQIAKYGLGSNFRNIGQRRGLNGGDDVYSACQVRYEPPGPDRLRVDPIILWRGSVSPASSPSSAPSPPCSATRSSPASSSAAKLARRPLQSPNCPRGHGH